jgi:ProP effector
MTEVASSRPRRQRNPVLDRLMSSFNVFRDCQPLAIGIHKVIQKRLPDIDPKQLKTALRMHTASTRYLKELSTGNTRFDLDGSPAGEVTAEQRQDALGTLRERFRKKAEQLKAEQLAKQQQAKLQKLVEKFNAP